MAGRHQQYSDPVRRQLDERELSRLVIWTDSDGPVPAGPAEVGVEYRGLLGHHSSYGLLVGRIGGSSGAEFALEPMYGSLSVPCEEVRLGLTEREYYGALAAAGLLLGNGLVITRVAEGLYGSSIVVFTRLVAVLSTVLSADLETVDPVGIWATWHEPWRAVRAPSPGPADHRPGHP